MSPAPGDKDAYRSTGWVAGGGLNIEVNKTFSQKLISTAA